MSWSTVKSTLAETWYLVAALCAISLVVIYKLSTGGELEPPPGGRPGGGSPASAKATQTAAVAQVQTVRLTEEERARQTVAEYQERLADNPKHKDAPALLLAAGNLTMIKLKDFKEAARLYELLIHDYPAWEAIAGVYPQLMTCYEQLSDSDGLRWLYKKMMDEFPPESNEYKYAQAKLN